MKRRWPLLLSLIAGSIAAVVASAAWAGTPANQLPLLIVSLLAGAFLPAAAGAVWSHRGLTHQSAPSKRSAAQPPARHDSRSSSASTSEVLVFPWRAPEEGGCLLLFMFLGGIGFIAAGIAFHVSAAFRTEMMNRTAVSAPTATEVLPLTLLFLAIGAGTLAISVQQVRDRRELRIDASGFTVVVNRSEHRLLWEQVSAIAVSHGILFVESLALTEHQARRMTSAAAFRLAQSKGLGMLQVMWTPARPTAAICDLARLTVPSAPLFEAVERYSGRKVSQSDGT